MANLFARVGFYFGPGWFLRTLRGVFHTLFALPCL